MRLLDNPGYSIGFWNGRECRCKGGVLQSRFPEPRKLEDCLLAGPKGRGGIGTGGAFGGGCWP